MAALSALLLAAAAAAHGAAAAADAAPWRYAQGGAEWGGLCQRAFPQSPVDLALPEGVGGLDSRALRFHYPVVYPWQAGLAVRHDGARVLLNATAAGAEGLGYLLRDGVKFPVRRVEFHAPSEHTVRGRHADMEMQIVHQREGSAGDENLVVVAALFDAPSAAQRDNAWLQDALQWDHLPANQGDRRDLTRPFQLGMGVDGLHNGYYRYAGSLTAPPCSAQVEWNVLETVQHFSFAQKMAVNALFKDNAAFAQKRGNNRPVQPLMGRSVTLHNHKQAGDGDNRPAAAPRPEQEVPEAAKEAPRWDDKDVAPEAVNATRRAADEAAAESNPAAQPELYRLHGRDWSGACRDGRAQSPIDVVLETGNPHGDFEAVFKYKEVPITALSHLGYAVVVDPPVTPGVLAVGGLEYRLHRVSFHTPSEHLVDGRRADMEMQLVHRRALKVEKDGRAHDYAILSVLFHNGGFTENELLESLGSALPTKGGQSVQLGKKGAPEGVLFNLNKIVGLGEGYYSYAGSLSVPPCTEGVKRFVLRTVQDMSQIQLNRWTKAAVNNYRDVQPRNYRGVVVHNVNDHVDVIPPTRGAANALLPF